MNSETHFSTEYHPLVEISKIPEFSDYHDSLNHAADVDSNSINIAQYPIEPVVMPSESFYFHEPLKKNKNYESKLPSTYYLLNNPIPYGDLAADVQPAVHSLVKSRDIVKPSTKLALPEMEDEVAEEDTDDPWAGIFDKLAPVDVQPTVNGQAEVLAGEVASPDRPEIREAAEKLKKTHKLGKLATKAAAVITKGFDKVMANMGAISVLSPGSAVLYADQAGSAETTMSVELLATAEVAKRIEIQGYAKMAPHFRDQARDKTRTNTFTYEKSRDRGVSGNLDAHVETTEHEGLMGLARFLKNYIKQADIKGQNVLPRKNVAQSMLDRLTFIGEKEYAEAALGLGDYWKAYLDEDPKRQICAVTKISTRIKRKSDSYLVERILDTFSDEELERYSGRIVRELEDITAKPKDTKIILLDDWTISGTQMGAAYSSIKRSERFNQYAGSVEINVITSSIGRIQNGLKRRWNQEDIFIPLRAYYLAHDATAETQYEHRAHITGTHSSVDYDFETQLHYMVNDLDSSDGLHKPSSKRITMPPLTNIIRSYYRTTPAVEVNKDGRIVRKKERE